jgi:hypothetical protein
MGKNLDNIKENVDKKLLEMLTSEKETIIQRSQITSADFDADDPNKQYGNVTETVYDSLIDVSKSTNTPILGMLESRGYGESRSTLFDMHSITIPDVASSNFKLGENDDAYEPTNTYDRKTNSIMTVGVGFSAKILASILPKRPVPTGQEYYTYQLEQQLKKLAIAKEDYLFNGKQSNPNETDGIFTILQREKDNDNTATSLTYTGPVGSNILNRQDLENMIFSAIVTNGADPSSLVLFVCDKAIFTISSWFENKISYTTSNFFTFLNMEQPVYKSLLGYSIPIMTFNTSRISNTSDKVLLLDANELGLMRYEGFARIKDMSNKKPHDDISKVVMDSLGLSFFYTKTSGYIAGIDATTV